MGNWQPLIKSKVIFLNTFLGEWVVTEIKEGYEYGYKYYWIHCGYHIDVICIDNNGKLIGQGAKKYEKEIKRAIRKFKLDGLDESKIVLLPPNRNPLHQPAVMYDITDYYLISLGELDKLEREFYKKSYYDLKINEGYDEVKIEHKNVCIMKLPLKQDVIDDIWNWREKGLKRFLDKEFGKMF
jgi:hypothetical protein